MQVLGLLGMYFDAAVVFVTNSSLLFRLVMAILWGVSMTNLKSRVLWVSVSFIAIFGDLG